MLCDCCWNYRLFWNYTKRSLVHRRGFSIRWAILVLTRLGPSSSDVGILQSHTYLWKILFSIKSKHYVSQHGSKSRVKYKRIQLWRQARCLWHFSMTFFTLHQHMLLRTSLFANPGKTLMTCMSDQTASVNSDFHCILQNKC